MAKQLISLAVVAGLACLGGCTGPGKIRHGSTTLPADDGSAAYLDRISSQKDVSQNDAFRGVLLLLKIDDAGDTFAQRTEKLLGRGIVDKSWSLDASRAITKGQTAYVIYQACKVRGGLILTLTGPSRRYCLRELQYQGFMTSGIEAARVSGGEFVAVLSRADSYLRTGEVPEISTTSEGP